MTVKTLFALTGSGRELCKLGAAWGVHPEPRLHEGYHRVWIRVLPSVLWRLRGLSHLRQRVQEQEQSEGWFPPA